MPGYETHSVICSIYCCFNSIPRASSGTRLYALLDGKHKPYEMGPRSSRVAAAHVYMLVSVACTSHPINNLVSIDTQYRLGRATKGQRMRASLCDMLMDKSRGRSSLRSRPLSQSQSTKGSPDPVRRTRPRRCCVVVFDTKWKFVRWSASVSFLLVEALRERLARTAPETRTERGSTVY